MRHPKLVCLFAAAMGILEAIVVVYLRRIYYPDGFAFPLVPMDPPILRAEVIREAMTLIMLACVAWIAAERPWSRPMAFLVAFGVWDIAYYAGLKAFLGWPESPLAPDILFLIPKIWVGPVLAPVLVAGAWVLGGLALHRARYEDLGMGAWSWAPLSLSVFGILAAFLSPGGEPEAPRFLWVLFGTSYLLGVVTLAGIALRWRGMKTKAPSGRALDA